MGNINKKEVTNEVIVSFVTLYIRFLKDRKIYNLIKKNFKGNEINLDKKLFITRNTVKKEENVEEVEKVEDKPKKKNTRKTKEKKINN